MTFVRAGRWRASSWLRHWKRGRYRAACFVTRPCLCPRTPGTLQALAHASVDLPAEEVALLASHDGPSHGRSTLLAMVSPPAARQVGITLNGRLDARHHFKLALARLAVTFATSRRLGLPSLR